jgi:cytochrome c551
MKRKLLGLLLGTSLVLAACGGGDEAKEPAGDGGATTVNAEKIYTNSCASCHGQNFEGGVGTDLTAVGSKYSAEEIEEIIHEGIPGTAMRAKIIVGEEATAVANWLAENNK